MRRFALMLTLALAFSVLASRVAAAQYTQEALAGPFKFDLKMGPSLGAFDFSGTQFRLEPHFGFNLTPASPHHIYLDIPLGFGFGNNLTTIAILPGVEGDIALPVGVPIYIEVLGGLGVAFFIPSFRNADTQTAFGIRFGVGVKYVLNGQWNFFFEPFNLEIYPVGLSAGPVNLTGGFFNLMFGAGINF